MSHEYDYDDEEEYDSDEMPAAERELAEDAHWKVIQKNTFTRWANEHLKSAQKSMNDLETELSDGLKLLALVEVLAGHRFARFNKRPSFRTQKLENVTMVLKFLEIDEGIRIVNIDSSDIVDHKLKLILGLIWTLILHYSISMPMWEDEDGLPPQEPKGKQTPTPKQRLLQWVQGKLPDRPINNFTTDWNDGTAIGALVDACAPGLCPDWPDWDPKNKAKNAKDAMDAAEKWLGVPQLIKPEEMCNPKVDEMSMMTYLSQFPNAKLKEGAPLRPRANPNRVRAYGPGLEATGSAVGAPARFTVETFSAGAGNLEITVLNPRGKQEPCKQQYNDDRNKTYSCEYLPTVEGEYRIIIKFNGKEIPKSPFRVQVEGAAGDPNKVTAKGPGLEKNGVQVAKPTWFEVFTKGAGAGQVDVVILDPHGHKDSVKPRITSQGDDSFLVEYAPREEGLHSINIFFAGHAIPKSPYGVMVESAVDARKCYASGRGIQPKGVRVKDNADFKVHCKDAGPGPMEATVHGPNGQKVPVRVTQLDPDTYGCEYVPTTNGPHVINITYGGQHIPRSPFKVEVGPFKTSRIVAFGPGLEGGVVDMPADFTVETNGETGALGFSIEGPSQAKIDCKDRGDGSADVTYWPTTAGEYAVHVLCDDEDIPKSPFMAQVVPNDGSFDPRQAKAYGPGLERTGVAPNKWAEFTVDTRAAGKAPLAVTCVDENYQPLEVQVKDNRDGTYTCRYMPKRPVKHTVTITYGGVNVPDSPFRVYVSEASRPAKVKVYGPGVEKGVKTFTPTYFIVDCKEAGPGDVAIALTDEKGMDVPVNYKDNGDGTFTIEYEPKSVGTYMCNVYFANQEVPQSPLKIEVEANVDVSKIKVQGLEPSVFMDSATEFTVDAKSVTPTGEGKVSTVVTGPSGNPQQAMVTNNNDGTYKVTYAPFEQGPHTVDVQYENTEIPKSPFNVSAVPGCDPTKVKAYGPGLEGGYTDQPQIFTVETKGAGPGGLSLAIEGPSEAQMNCKDNRDGTCTVKYDPTKPGDYDITVKFADEHIPGSPFRVNIKDVVDAGKVQVYGEGVSPAGVKSGQPALFHVDTSAAGEAPLTCTATDGSGRPQPCQMQPKPDGTVDCTYYPEVQGPCAVDVKYAGQPVPGSPFQTRVNPPFDASKVRVQGDGVTSGIPASLPVTFVIDTRDAGVAELDVAIQGPDGRYLRPDIMDNGDGTFTVQYTPEDVGTFSVNVRFGGQPVPGAPFKVKTVPTGDASKVIITDMPNKTVIVGDKCVIEVDASDAGNGNVTCRIRSPQGNDLDIDIVDNGDGTCSIYYTPSMLGAYTINIKFGGEPVPNGQFTQQALPEDEFNALKQQAQQAAPQDYTDNEDAYAPVDFCFQVGPIFNFVSAYVKMPSGQTAYPKIEDNRDGTVTIRYQPTEVGVHELHLNYNDQPIQGSPFKFHVDQLNSGYVTAYGPGLTHGNSGENTNFTIVTKDAGAGGLSLAVEGPSKAEITCRDNKDGTCSVNYLPTAPGEYNIIVKYNDQHISGSPFTAKIAGEAPMKAQLSVGSSSELSLKVVEADIASLSATIVSPSGVEEPCILKRLANGHLGISFTPKEIGQHEVNVLRNGRHIANSPFKIYVGESEIGNANKVRCYGQGLERAMANDLNEFTVDTKHAGYGGLSLSIEGPSKADIKCNDNADGSVAVTYQPTEPGTYIINVKFADEHVPGSPFAVKVGGEPSGRVTERITRRRETVSETGVGSQCELSLKIPGTNPRDMVASVTSPSGLTEHCEIRDLDDSHYSIKFVPKEMGVHTVSVKHKNMHIPGSPFQFTVGPITEGGAHKVRAGGPGLERGEVETPCEFNVYTREAGAGGLSIAVEGPSKADINFEDRRDGSCGVNYVVTEPGEYLVSIKFNDQHIPDSPFRVNVSPSSGDAKKLTVAALQERGLSVGKPAAFTVNFNGAQGRLSARVVAPSGAEDDALIQQVDTDTYAVRFIPRENGIHYVYVRFNDTDVPGSPFRILVGQSGADPGLVTASGDGLHRGSTGRPAEFVVNTLNAGSGALTVTVDGPSKVALHCVEVAEGYKFSYTPTAPGDYLITIRYAGPTHIAGSPFKAKITGPGRPSMIQEQSQLVVETVTKSDGSSQHKMRDIQQTKGDSDATKVRPTGPGLQQASVNSRNQFTVDCKQAGHDMLMVGVYGPGDRAICEEVNIKHSGHKQYTVFYSVRERGDYVLVVKWGDHHIPGSPFLIEAK